MKLIDGIKLKGRPAEIPDCSRDDLPDFFVEMGYKVGAEIGAYKGEFSKKFCQAGLILYAIDPWRIYKDLDNPKNLKWQPRLDSHYEQTKATLAPHPNCTIIRKTSMEAVEDFVDESLDFVYIDGSHEFRYIAEDLYEWSAKVRQGGIVSGHDYAYFRPSFFRESCHVRQVVDAYVSAYGIKNFWVLGRKEYVESERRDKWRSWMWIKT